MATITVIVTPYRHMRRSIPHACSQAHQMGVKALIGIAFQLQYLRIVLTRHRVLRSLGVMIAILLLLLMSPASIRSI